MDQLLREQLRPEEGKGQCVLHCTCHVQKHILCTTTGKGVPPSSSRGSHWPGLPAAQLDQLFADEATPPGKGEGLSAGVSTEKTSMAHSAVITARDAAFQASPHILRAVPGVCVCHLLALVDYPYLPYATMHRSTWCVWRMRLHRSRGGARRQGRRRLTGGPTGPNPYTLWHSCTHHRTTYCSTSCIYCMYNRTTYCSTSCIYCMYNRTTYCSTCIYCMYNRSSIT